MNKLIILFLVFTFLSCVSKSNYEKLKSDYTVLKIKYDSIIVVNEKLEHKFKIESSKNYTEEDVKAYLKDYYSFYNANMIYRNPKIRKLEYNKFVISLEECVKRGGFTNDNFFWNSSVLTLTINEDGTYKVQGGIR